MKAVKRLIGFLVLLAGVGSLGTFSYARYYSGDHLHLQKVQMAAHAGTVEYEIDLHPAQSPISVLIGEVKKGSTKPTGAHSFDLRVLAPDGEQIWQSDARISVPSKKSKRKRGWSWSLTTNGFPNTSIHKVASIDEHIEVRTPGTHRVQIAMGTGPQKGPDFELAVWMRQNTMVVPTVLGILGFALLIAGGFLLRGFAPGFFRIRIGGR